jgi:hypothetical protein
MKDKLKFDVSSYYKKAKAYKNSMKIEGVSINLPFITINVASDQNDKKIAREIIIRIRDKRVLNSKECCEGCIENSLNQFSKSDSSLLTNKLKLRI